MWHFLFSQNLFLYRTHPPLFWSEGLFLRDKSRGRRGGSPCRVPRRECWSWSWSPSWSSSSAAPRPPPSSPSCSRPPSTAISDSKYSEQFQTIWSLWTLLSISTFTASVAPRSGELLSWPFFGANPMIQNLVKPLPCRTFNFEFGVTIWYLLGFSTRRMRSSTHSVLNTTLSVKRKLWSSQCSVESSQLIFIIIKSLDVRDLSITK